MHNLVYNFHYESILYSSQVGISHFIFISFNVGTQSNFSLSLTGLSADADVQLLNSSGGVISSSTAGGTTFHNY
ncbi:PPC domain-containing protein [Dolichospermum planctonicum UHCC 0167]|uniref:PPC domain-containing protein n=1 Tax=Dolichospermum planctonicum TaxID=136072 RepID=UPI0014433859|nr:PPC domain-containing protein [Dolichospermum planctonicum]MCW9680135.1 PPC domain-containing protein [Dolichospermum planctonicum UHCC 0167]